MLARRIQADSKVAGRLSLDIDLSARIADGLMTDKLVYADTTGMNVSGSVMADFRKQEVAVRAVPKAKQPEFFSLATPVGVSRSFDDYRVSINPVELTGTL